MRGDGRVCSWNNKTIKKHKDAALLRKSYQSSRLNDKKYIFSQISAVRTGRMCVYGRYAPDYESVNIHLKQRDLRILLSLRVALYIWQCIHDLQFTF